MSFHQHDPQKSYSNPSTKLVDDERDPPADPSFVQEGPEDEEDSSSLHSELETFYFGSENAYQGKLSPLFCKFYKVAVGSHILMCVAGIIHQILGSLLTETTPKKLELLMRCWALMQYLIAYSGMMKKDLNKVETSYRMMKIYFVLIGVALAIPKKNRSECYLWPCDESLESPVSLIATFVFLIFLPTRKVINAIKSNNQEEEVHGLTKRLDSLWFTIYKYALLINFFLETQGFIAGIIEDFSDVSKFWRLFFMRGLLRHCQTLLSIAFSFFAFEGLRTKNLKKIEISIKLMKMFIFVDFVLSALKWQDTGFYWRKSIGVFLPERMIAVLLISVLALYGARRARDILKDHERSGHKL